MPPARGATRRPRVPARCVAAASYDEALTVTRVADGTVLAAVHCAHAGGVLSCAYAPDGRMLASAGADGFAVLWYRPLQHTPESHAQHARLLASGRGLDAQYTSRSLSTTVRWCGYSAAARVPLLHMSTGTHAGERARTYAGV